MYSTIRIMKLFNKSRSQINRYGKLFGKKFANVYVFDEIAIGKIIYLIKTKDNKTIPDNVILLDLYEEFIQSKKVIV